jgi:membrane protease YdiL (CAAX protease family)
VQGVLARHLTPWVAVLLSGVLFGAAHMTPWVLLPISGLGVLLGGLFYRSGSLTAACFGHGLFNLISFLELSLTGDPASQEFESVAVQPLPILIGAAFLIVGIHMTRATQSRTRQPR